MRCYAFSRFSPLRTLTAETGNTQLKHLIFLTEHMLKALCVWSLQRRCKNKKASGRNMTEFNSYSIRIFFQNWKWEHLEQRRSDQCTWIQQHECLNSVVDPSQFKDNLVKHSQTGSSKWNINPPCGTDRASYTVIYRQTASSKSGRLPGSQEYISGDGVRTELVTPGAHRMPVL